MTIGITQEAKDKLLSAITSVAKGLDLNHIARMLERIPILPAPDKWEPTHVHADGGEYMVVGTVKVKGLDEWYTHVLYTDQASSNYARTQQDFDARFRPINPHRELLIRGRKYVSGEAYTYSHELVRDLCDALEAK